MKFMDGSGFTATGQAVAKPAPIVPTTGALNPSNIKIDPAKTVPAVNVADAVSSGDINSLLKQNQTNFQNQLKAFDYSPEYRSLQKSFNDTQSQLRGLQTNYVQNQVGIENKAIPMDEIGNELTRLQKNVAFKQLPLTNELQAVTDQLKTLQEDRNNTLAKLQVVAQQGQYDAGLAMKFNEIKKAEQTEARKLAREYGITSQFYVEGGTVYRTSDGKAYSNENDFFTDAGVASFNEARDNGQLIDLGMSIENQLKAKELQAKLNESKYQSVINPITGERMVFNPRTGEYSGVEGGLGGENAPNFGLSPNLYQNAAKIADDFRLEQVVKDYNVAQNKYQSVTQIIDSQVGGPGDLAAVYEFMKALDPTSVVRETEYESAAKSGNIFSGALARYNGYLKEEGGFLPDNVKSAFKSIVDTKYQLASKQYMNLYNDYSRRIDAVTGKPGVGSQMITNYQTAFDADPLLAEGWDNIIGNGVDTAPPVDIDAALKSGGLTFNSVGNTSASGNQVKGYTSTASKLQPIANLPQALSTLTGNSRNLATSLVSKFAPNSIGGQCGDFVRKAVSSFGMTYPRLGNGLNEKITAVQKYGTSIANAKLGSVIVTKENPTYGHVAWIVGRNDKGFVLAESNFAQSNRISYGRVIPYSSKQIVGVINPYKA